MVLKRQFQSRLYGKAFIFACIIAVFLNIGFTFAVESQRSSTIARYRVFSPKNISASQARRYLELARVGTVSQIPGTNTLLVTAQPAELIKASAIVKLVDSKQQFVVKTIAPASEAKNLPSNNSIAKQVGGDLLIGTFMEPPVDDTTRKAIIDLHEDAVIAIATVETIDKIVSAIEKLQAVPPQTPSRKDTLTPGTVLDQPSAPSTVEQPDELLDMIAEVEKMEAELKALDARQKLIRKTKPKAVDEVKKLDETADEQLRKKILPQVAEDERAEEAAFEPEIEQPDEFEEQPPIRFSYEPEPIEIADETLELDLPEKLNIIDLLDLVGKYLNLDYMYDPTKVKGEVTLKVQGPIKVKNLYPLLESVLKFRGFVMARRQNLVTIVPAAEVLDIDPTLLETEESRIQYGDVIVTRFFDLEHIDTASAKNLLDGMKLGVNITPIAETGTLIVTGYAYRMARIEQLLEVVDKPGEPKEFRYRQLQYTMAATLAPKIKTLAEELGTVSISIAAPAKPAPQPARRGRRRRQPAKPAAKPAAGAAKQPAVYLDADERTNRILMIGFESQLAVVDSLIDALDVEQQDFRTLRLYEIQHVGAEEVRDKLAELDIIGGGGPAPRTRSARTKGKAQAAAPAAGEALVEEPQVIIVEATNSLLVNATAEQHAQIAMIIGYVDNETLEKAIPYVIYPLENQNPEDLAGVLEKLIQETIKDKEGKIQKTVRKVEEDIVIVPDESTFSIIVYASKKNQEWIRSLIEQLDRRRPQVLIDVTLVEVSRTDLFDLDLQLATKFPKLQTDSAMSVVDAIVTPFVGGTGEASFVGGLGQGFYSDAHIQALLTAIQTKSYGRVLARPKVLVNDGQQGVIKTANKTNVTVSQTIVPDQGTTQTTTDFREYSAGITLTITPNISEGDLLRLEVEMVRSDFLDAPAEGAPPDTVETNINTVVTVPNNRTIILGGLLKLNQAKGGTKVPILGDIPLVGGLFRSTSNSARDTKTYIFVKANILRPDKALAGSPELERISQRNRAAFERFEEEFQSYEDWPGIKPKPIDPLRVLDAE